VVILYSSLGESPGSKDGCSYGEALAGFAAFFSDSSNEMVFLKSEFSGDSKAIITATDNFLGKGAWKTIINGPNKGSSHLFELVKLLMSRSDRKEQLLSYLKFMGKFGIDASKVDVAWDSTHKRYITLGDLAK